MSWLVIIVIGVATYLLRASFLITRKGEATPTVERALRFVPVAILPALVASATIGGGGHALPPRILAVLFAAVVAWKTRSVALTMASGLVLLWLIEYSMGFLP